MAERRAINDCSGIFILLGAEIGPKATASRLRKCPSQPSCAPQATFSSVGLRRGSVACFSPIARGKPSAQDSPGLWQLAQARASEADRTGSKNNIRPSLNLASE